MSIVTDVRIYKITKGEPRFPDQSGGATAAYVLECKLDDGSAIESPFFLTEQVGEMSPSRTGDMLELFAAAMRDYGHKKAA